MQGFKDRKYFPDCGHNDSDIDAHFTRDEVFGKFIENGRAYQITRRDTPRGWTQYLCNDKVRCGVTNVGKGYLFHAKGMSVTKQYESNGNYLPRNLNGERKLYIEIDEKQYEFFSEAENFLCTVRPGYVTFNGDIAGIGIELRIIVPLTAPCECWSVKFNNKGNNAKAIKISVVQDVSCIDAPDCDYEINSNNTEIKVRVISVISGITTFADNIFTASKVSKISAEKYTEQSFEGETLAYLRERIEVELSLSANSVTTYNIVSSACDNEIEEQEIRQFVSADVFEAELCKIITLWDDIIKQNYCVLPDKNLEYFLNIWLKNNLYLTYRYDRATHLIGYRDSMQDSWGYIFVEPKKAKQKMLFSLSYMHPDGRCPRGIDKFGERHDLDDYCDAPVWIAIMLNYYIKETGDYSVLDEQVGFFKSEQTATVEEHIWSALDYMYHSRGTNGLILMRDGDWADGLGGINKYGQGATSAWVTIGAYHAQNLMAEIYRQIGQCDKAEEMLKRSAEYKKIVNDVAWDGNWLVYAFFEDGEPIGSHKNLEGKIWLNAQTWGILTGIIDDEKRIKKISDAVSRYLDTPYGALVMYPPYVFYGGRCGRIQRQRPGMFLNSSIYNHAATFKVYSDIKRGDYDVAYDTLMRCLPNHPDNPDTRRTSEPFSVCNVYYGPNHPRYGMNLFSFFTAAPAWLIHGGFEELLGVKATFNGIEIAPHVPDAWDGYFVSKRHCGTTYNITFEKSEAEKCIIVDGKIHKNCTVNSNTEICEILVKF